jgi:hypothetical protein
MRAFLRCRAIATEIVCGIVATPKKTKIAQTTASLGSSR